MSTHTLCPDLSLPPYCRFTLLSGTQKPCESVDFDSAMLDACKNRMPTPQPTCHLETTLLGAPHGCKAAGPDHILFPTDSKHPDGNSPSTDPDGNTSPRQPFSRCSIAACIYVLRSAPSKQNKRLHPLTDIENSLYCRQTNPANARKGAEQEAQALPPHVCPCPTKRTFAR